MGRLLILLLIIVAAVLLWKAFGPGTWKRTTATPPVHRIKGPDDDPEFLWKLEKEQFKRRRAEEHRKQQEAEQSPPPPDSERPGKTEDEH
ncbi:hypothetical protein GSS88_07565 [Corynebacterium sp. 3HC-13]|uniref:hypothetical protein n=1 Tax=Corynebacterium poyangense TaxID=2684405 RepID=UPI001CCC2D53|nr:hypothetical protein [Corynebacterium poyangense]MBZ8177649.1 hypothetical protein [Corynebacterium poyangense]